MAIYMKTSQILPFTEKATSITELNQAHAQMLKTGLIHDHFAASRLISVATTISNPIISYAYSVFEDIQHQNSFNYNTLIRAYANSQTPENALQIFLQMLDKDLFPDKYTYTFTLKACSILGRIRDGEQVLGHLIKSDVGFDSYIFNTLIHMYAKCGNFEVALKLLDEMPERDVISWNAILSVYVEMRLIDLARELFDEMPVKNVESWNFMISGYVGSGLIQEARKVFDEMPVRNIVAWNTIVTAYGEAGLFGEVFLLFQDMQISDVQPDDDTFVNVLSACARVGSLDNGERVHTYIEKNGFDVSGILATALVDMYLNCGSLEKALEVLHTTPNKDISTWNAMLAGLRIDGHGKQALQVFSELINDGFKPNEVTFVSVLSSCSRSGLLKEGRDMFDQMIRLYKIQPTIEHYGCFVDLLCRFDLLEEAEELAKRIPFDEVNDFYESLLDSCRNHGNVELGEKIAKKLLELDPTDTASYVLLSNLKASLENGVMSPK